MAALATPRRPGLRNVRGNYPSSSRSTASGQDPSVDVRSTPAAHGKPVVGVNGPLFAKSEGKGASSSTLASMESLKILEDCVIFVDVRADTGDEAGSLFIEMLEGVGARILTRVGQTCTHIVYKNGLMSTLTRYRLLREPKPLVVGIAWVVECVEQRKRVNESKFLVNLTGVNVTNKRRRSMLPKLIAREPEDITSPGIEHSVISMDRLTSSVMLDDDCTPLELARRRKIVQGSP